MQHIASKQHYTISFVINRDLNMWLHCDDEQVSESRSPPQKSSNIQQSLIYKRTTGITPQQIHQILKSHPSVCCCALPTHSARARACYHIPTDSLHSSKLEGEDNSVAIALRQINTAEQPVFADIYSLLLSHNLWLNDDVCMRASSLLVCSFAHSARARFTDNLQVLVSLDSHSKAEPCPRCAGGLLEHATQYIDSHHSMRATQTLLSATNLTLCAPCISRRAVLYSCQLISTMATGYSLSLTPIAGRFITLIHSAARLGSR